jgi:hypothetical protein
VHSTSYFSNITNWKSHGLQVSGGDESKSRRRTKAILQKDIFDLGPQRELITEDFD